MLVEWIELVIDECDVVVDENWGVVVEGLEIEDEFDVLGEVDW